MSEADYLLLILKERGVICVKFTTAFCTTCPEAWVQQHREIIAYVSDINECAENADNCDKETSTCANQDGSFRCLCNKGLARADSRSCMGT